MPECDSGIHIVTPLGVCEPCPAFTKPMEGMRTCGAEVCNGAQVLMENGRCQDCPPYETPKKDRSGCYRIVCDAGLSLTMAG